MPEFLAVIPARSGSKGVPDKNIRVVGGHPLLAWSIAAAKLSSTISRIVVSTDSDKYAAIARRYGAETPFLRPPLLASDASLDVDFMLHALKWMKSHENYAPDYLVHLRPTSPAREPQILDQAMATIQCDPLATSLVSAFPVTFPPGKYLRLNPDGLTFQSYLGGVDVNAPRQSFPQAFRGSGYVDIINVASLIRTQSHLGDRILSFITSDPGDLDDADDLRRLEQLLRKNSPRLAEYLDSLTDGLSPIHNYGKI